MPLIYNGTNIESIVHNGVNLDKVVYNGTIVWEALVADSWSKNTYINTGAGHTGGWTKEWTQDMGYAVKPYRVGFSCLINNGHTCYYTFYGSNDNSSWVQLATGQRSSSGTTEVDVYTDTFYRYYRVTQQNSNWRRDDGNEVFSIEPWKIYFYRRK